MAYYEARQWPAALDIFRRLALEAPENIGYLGLLGTTLAKLGRQEEALRVSERLALVKRPYLFGLPTDQRGCIAAALGDKAGAVELFRRAEREGAWYDYHAHRERCPDELRDYPPFLEFMRPKG